jgi:hypothetical protein
MVELAHVLSALLGSLTLLCLSLYIALACGGRSELLYSTATSHPELRFHHRVFFLLAAAGLLVCLYQGADFMLSWMPDSWGNVGEDGDYTTLRAYVAGLFAMAGGLFLCQFIDRATHDKFDLREAHVREGELERVFEAIHFGSATALAQRACDYESQAARLSMSTQDARKAGMFIELAQVTKSCEVGLTRYGARLEDELRRVGERLQREEANNAAERSRHGKQATAAEWELDYLRKNPGARVEVRCGEESQNGSYLADRVLLSPSGEVVRSSRFGRLAT